MKYPLLTVLTLLSLLCLVQANSYAQAFVHPGVMHTQADIDLIKAKRMANEEPWASAYTAFAADSHDFVSGSRCCESHGIRR